MLIALVVALSLTTPAPVRADDPPVQVWIDPSGSLVQGDRVRVHVRTAQDAYVVVLRVDGEGRVRALFPLDPGEDDFVRGGRNVEVRGRSDREAFLSTSRTARAWCSRRRRRRRSPSMRSCAATTGPTACSPPTRRATIPRPPCSTSSSAWPATSISIMTS